MGKKKWRVELLRAEGFVRLGKMKNEMEWSYWQRIVYIGTVFITVIFYGAMLGDGPSLSNPWVMRVWVIAIIWMSWLPFVIAWEMGRMLTVEKFLMTVLITGFLANEVRVRIVGNLFSPFC